MPLSFTNWSSRSSAGRTAPAGQVRVLCSHCGAHVFAQSGFRIAGQCLNCGSYELDSLPEDRG